MTNPAPKILEWLHKLASDANGSPSSKRVIGILSSLALIFVLIYSSLHETKPVIFRNKLEQERKGTLEFLDDISHSVNKLTVSDLKEMLLDFRTRLSISQTKLKT